LNSEKLDQPIDRGTKARCPAGSVWGDPNETKRVVEEMAEAERRTRHEKTLALRALRLSQVASKKPREPTGS